MVVVRVCGNAARRGLAIAVICCLALLAGCTAGASRTPGPASGSASGSASAGGTGSTSTLEIDGRPVLLYVPASRPAAGPADLVVVLHGYNGDAAGVLDFFGLRALADQRGFLIAAPQGTIDPQGRSFWNASRACCNFHGSTVDDSGHLSRVIATLVAGERVDPARVYVVGHSNGAFMAQTLACEHAAQVAAIASVAGAMDTDAACEPAVPVSVLQVHGRADDTIRYDGGQINGRPYTSADQTVARWVLADGCSGSGRAGTPLDADAKVAGVDLTPTTWTGCRAGTEVALWTIADSSHLPTLTSAFTAALIDWLEAHNRHR